jgi:hypothetical protein
MAYDKEYMKDWEKHGKQRAISVVGGGQVKKYAPHELEIERPDLHKKMFGSHAAKSKALERKKNPTARQLIESERGGGKERWQYKIHRKPTARELIKSERGE